MNVNSDWFRAIILSTAHFTQHFYDRIIPPLIPVLSVQLGFPLWKLGLLITARTLGAGLFQAPMGHLSDRVDRRLILPSGAALLALGYFGFVYAPVVGGQIPSFTVAGNEFGGVFLAMLLTMFVGGIGASVAHPVGYPLITSNVSPAWKGKALGLWSSSSKLGDATAAVVIGLLLIGYPWETIVLSLSVLGVVYAAALYTALGWFDTAPPDGEMVDESTESASVFAGDRRRYVYPMIAILAIFITRIFAAQGVYTFTPAFITDVYGYSLSVLGQTIPPESLASLYFTVLLVTAAGAQLVGGTLTDRFDHRKMLFGFLLAAAISIGVLSVAKLPPFLLFFIILFIGATLWGADPARDYLVSDISPPDAEGRTFGYIWTTTQLIGAISPALFGFIADTAGIRISFGVVALVLLFGAIAVLPLFSRAFYVSGTISEAEHTSD